MSFRKTSGLRMAFRYFNQRHSGADGRPARLNLKAANKLLAASFTRARERGWFDGLFGARCVDGDSPGLAGSSPEMFILSETWLEGAFPIPHFLSRQRDEAKVFTLIEFLGQHASTPINDERAWFHEFNQCGWHYEDYDPINGFQAWRAEVNKVLENYGDGFEMNDAGEIQRLGDPGLREIFDAPLPPSADPKLVVEKVDHAIKKYRAGRSTLKEQQEAARELADVLEVLRPKAQLQLSTKDENDLYNIINNFGIRHHNIKQKTDLRGAWLSWVFYLFLSTIHLLLNLEDKKQRRGQ